VETAFRLRPALSSDLPWIAERQSSFYASDAVPLTVLQQWHEANPGGFSILEDRDGLAQGQITFLPLKPDCLQRYMSGGPGGMVETEIEGRHIFGPAERHLVHDLYLESIILPEIDRSQARTALFRALPKLISDVSNPACQGDIYALAATAAGERWLTRMGFMPIALSEPRRDGHPIFRSTLQNFLHSAARVLDS